MRASTVFAIGASLLSFGCATPLQKREADFLSVRTRTQKDMRGASDASDEKYFHESAFHLHYDGRFAEEPLAYEAQTIALRSLVQTYLATSNDLKIETWLMHGTLLGWWWGKKIMPWDSDIDVQVSEPSMFFLAAYYNMSIFHFKTRTFPEGRSYMLEINPHYTNREQTDKANVIDARWIDTESGLFIDITTARYNLSHPQGEGMLSCKDGHEYRDTYLLPLRSTKFEGVEAKIPYRYQEMLVAEYGEDAIKNTRYKNHIFEEESMQWIPEFPEQEYEPKGLYDTEKLTTTFETAQHGDDKVPRNGEESENSS